MFTPKLGEDEPILTNMFQMGGFNHQLVFPLFCFFCRVPWMVDDKLVETEIYSHQ